jgi:predicted DsbA family dithiol-disulfide isomerase
MTAGSPERDLTMRAALAATGPRSLLRPVPLVCLIADLVCPWCYIAFMRLQRVLAGGAATMTWHPFLLNPHLPPRGVTRTQYLERRFGSVAQAYGVHRRVVQVGDREGIPFAFGAIRAQPNTLAAHALVQAAAEHGREIEAVEALFHAFFAEWANIGDPDVLARIGGELGFTAKEVMAATSPAAADRVVAAHERAFALGIGGVPVTVLGDDHVIAGAQPPEVLEALLDLERYRLELAASAGAAPRAATPRSRP